MATCVCKETHPRSVSIVLRYGNRFMDLLEGVRLLSLFDDSIRITKRCQSHKNWWDIWVHNVGLIWSVYVGMFRFVYSCKTGLSKWIQRFICFMWVWIRFLTLKDNTQSGRSLRDSKKNIWTRNIEDKIGLDKIAKRRAGISWIPHNSLLGWEIMEDKIGTAYSTCRRDTKF
jgi:hypothetical protein